MSLLIGLGFRSKHGKDTAAQAIISARSSLFDVRRYAFSDVLKLEAYEALMNHRHPYWAAMNKLNPAGSLFYANVQLPKPWNSLLDDDGKLAWIEEHKDALRYLLQTYGTEFRRNNDPFYWVKRLAEKIHQENPTIALITDMRFMNETFFIKANNGYTINVVRQGFDNGYSGHVSEQQLIGYTFDFEIIVPDGQLEELKSDAVAVFDEIVDELTMKDMPTSEFTEAAFEQAA